MMSSETKPLRIFVVDDHKDIADGLADVLRMHGHEVEVAYNGQQAIRIFREKEFDISFMDVMMPGMNGVESFMEIRKIRPAAKVIMMTGYSVEQLLDQAVQEGACGILHKPININDVLDAMDRIQSKGMVLIADDDPEFSGAIKDVLMDDGYKVCVARTGGEALKTVMSGGVDYLVLDLKLPVISGLEVYLQLRNRGQDIPTIIVTGQPKENSEALDAFRSLEVTGILTKPFDTSSLLQQLGDMSGSLGAGLQPEEEDAGEGLFMAKPDRSEDRPRFTIERTGYKPEASAADEAAAADDEGLAGDFAEPPMAIAGEEPSEPMAPEAPAQDFGMPPLGRLDGPGHDEADLPPAMAPMAEEPAAMPEPAPEPTLESAPEPAMPEPYEAAPLESEPLAVSEPSSGPSSEFSSGPSSEPAFEPAPEPQMAPEPVSEPAPEPQMAPEPTPEPVAAPEPAPLPAAPVAREPAAPAPVPQPAPSAPPSEGGFRGQQRTGRIIAVDDDVDLVEGIAEVLRATGYEVETAKNEQEAKDKIQEFDAQVALLDIRLGRSNGLDLIPYMKEQRPEIFCIVITGNADKESAITALRSGAFDYLTKPLALDKLFTVLDRCLGKFDMHQRLQAAFEELQGAKDTAVQQSQESTDFFSRYSEELRQLVEDINNGIAPLIVSQDDADETQGAQIRGKVERLYDLIESSNAFIQASSGRSEGQEQRLDICDIAEKAVDEIKKLYADAAPQVSLSLPQERPVIWGREAQLQEMMVSMMSQATDIGGGTADELLLGLKKSDEGALLIVVKGPSVELESDDMSKLLEPFGATDVAMKLKQDRKGNSMRLPLAAAIAEAHDGSLRLHGGQGQPFIASVTLPGGRILQGPDEGQDPQVGAA